MKGKKYEHFCSSLSRKNPHLIVDQLTVLTTAVSGSTIGGHWTASLEAIADRCSNPSIDALFKNDYVDTRWFLLLFFQPSEDVSREMNAAVEEGYKPPPEFQEDVKEPLVELSLTDSTELWLIQWPLITLLILMGKNCHSSFIIMESWAVMRGHLLYDMVNFPSQEPDVTVFLSSASESRIVGKISRRVSLVHYPEPNELEKLDSNNVRQMYQRSGGTSLTNSSHHFGTSLQSSRLRNSRSASGRAASTRSGRPGNSLSEIGEQSKPSKRRQVHEPTVDMGQSTQDSGLGYSGVTSTGSFEHSLEGKLKKIKNRINCPPFESLGHNLAKPKSAILGLKLLSSKIL